MYKKIIFILSFIFYFIFFISPINAVCPVCTVAVGGGVLLSRYLGVDDLIIGVWVGGLLVSLGLWMSSYIKKILFRGQQWLMVALLWVSTYFGFKEVGFIGHPTCKIHGHDKMLSGMAFGTIAFMLGFGLDYLLRKLNKKEPGKALFPYQKVVAPLFFLIIATIFSLQLCKWGIK
jgi:hypothetical protein